MPRRIEFAGTPDQREKIRVLLSLFGIDDEKTLESLQHADNKFLLSVQVDIMMSSEFQKLLDYLRS